MTSDNEIPEGAKRLDAFIGEWSVTGYMRDGVDHFSISGHWSYTESVDGWGVSGLMHTDIDGMGSFEERELIGLDAPSGKIHMFSMNKFAIRDHVGTWEDDQTLVTRFEMLDVETETVEVITVRFTSPDLMEAIVIEQVDGETVLTTELELRRQPGP